MPPRHPFSLRSSPFSLRSSPFSLRSSLCFAAFLFACAHAPATPSPAQVLEQRYQLSQQAVAERCGIGVERLTLTSAGYMLDFRYRILDPEKATQVTSRGLRPYLEDPETKEVFSVPSPPKIGPLRQSIPAGQTLTRDRILFTLFANPGRNLKSGDRISVVMGDCRIDAVPIQ